MQKSEPSRLDTATRMARDADFSAPGGTAPPRQDPLAELSQLDKLMRILGEPEDKSNQGGFERRREAAIVAR